MEAKLLFFSVTEVRVKSHVENLTCDCITTECLRTKYYHSSEIAKPVDGET
jgi:hypothetical protein